MSVEEGTINFSYNVDSIDKASISVRQVSSRESVRFADLDSLHGFRFSELEPGQLVGLRFEFFLDPEEMDSEFLKQPVQLLYSSSLLTTQDTPILFHLSGLKPGKWEQATLWLPHYSTSAVGGSLDLQLFNPGKYYDRPKHLREVEDTHILPRVKNVSLREVPGLYVHKITLITDPKSNPKIKNKDDIFRAYPSLLEQDIPKKIFLTALAILLALLIFGLPFKIQIQFLFLFLVPIMLSFWFLLGEGLLGYFRNFEEAKLLELKRQIRSHLEAVMDYAQTSESLLKDSLNQNLLPSIEEEFRNQRRAGRNLKRNLNNTEGPDSIPKTGVWDPGNITTFSIDPIDQFLQEKCVPEGLQLVLNNGGVSYASHALLQGNTVLNMLARLFQPIISKEANIESTKVDKTNDATYELIRSVRKEVGSSLDNPRLMDDFMSNPGRPFKILAIGSARNLASPFSRSFWAFLNEVVEGQKEFTSWFVFGVIEKSRIHKELKSYLTRYALEEQNFEGAMRPAYHGINYEPSWPEAANLNTLAFLAHNSRVQGRAQIEVFEKEGSFYLGAANVYPAHTELAISLSLPLEPYLRKIRNEKNLLSAAAFAILFFVLLLVNLLAYRILKPFKKLEEGLHLIREGEFANPIEVQGKDQLADLAIRFNEMREALREKQLLSRFLSTMAMKSIESESEPSRRELTTIVFIGLDNLDELLIQEKRDPRLTMNEFLDIVHEPVARFGGYIDKFTGEASLCVFSGEDSDPLGAISTMKDRLEQQNLFLTSIGIARGAVVLGHVGASKRKDFTCIGDTVNTAARLMAFSDPESDSPVKIFMDQNCFEYYQLHSFKTRSHYGVHLKGKEGEFTIHEIL